jgi:hypothetical protein
MTPRRLDLLEVLEVQHSRIELTGGNPNIGFARHTAGMNAN